MKTYGFMLIDKPKGITSFDIIRKLRKITGIKKIGHSGTLDPFASGLMILCIGKATRLCSLITNETKEYVAKIILGVETDTLDSEGKIIKKTDISPFNENFLSKARESMLKLKRHTPPIFSAKKINGKKSYELARNGLKPNLEPTPIKVYSFDILEFNEKYITYKATVSKGTYIRTLSQIFASYINNIATTIELKRTRIGDIYLQNAVSLNKITFENYKIFIQTPEKILKKYQKSFLNDEELLSFKNGRYIKTNYKDDNLTMICNKDGMCVGFAKIENNLIKPKIVLI